MSRPEYQLSGIRFGRLQVIKKAENRNGSTYWLCSCDCGEEVIVKGSMLVHGKVKSCGCYNRDLTIERNKKRASKEPRNKRLYRIYYGMITRCYNSKEKAAYGRYGARGIRVCEEWKSDFYAFQKWAFENGYNDNLSIDRIDNDGDYLPENCRWTDCKTQANNRCRTKFLVIDGVSHSVSEWADIVGISRETIYGRLSNGWGNKEAVFTPVMTQFSHSRKQAV